MEWERKGRAFLNMTFEHQYLPKRKQMKQYLFMVDKEKKKKKES
jgi:hypothetical protein